MKKVFRGANKYFDNFKVRTGISSCPHDFLESNPLISVSISSKFHTFIVNKQIMQAAKTLHF